MEADAIEGAIRELAQQDSDISFLAAENERLRARLKVAKSRLTNNTPRWAREWPGIAGAIAEIDAALKPSS